MSLGTIRPTFKIQRCGPIIAGGAVGVPIGVALLSYIEPSFFKLFVGLVRYFALIVPAMLIPNAIGNKHYARLGDETFRKTVLLLLTVLSVAIAANAGTIVFGK